MGFYYTTVTRAKVLETNQFETTWTTNAYLQIENWVIGHCVIGSKMDLLNGDRVYRIHSNNISRLKLNSVEQRYIPTRVGDFFFDTVNPTLGQAKKDDTWLPIGP
jgi:hypothetical protein